MKMYFALTFCLLVVLSGCGGGGKATAQVPMVVPPAQPPQPTEQQRQEEQPQESTQREPDPGYEWVWNDDGTLAPGQTATTADEQYRQLQEAKRRQAEGKFGTRQPDPPEQPKPTYPPSSIPDLV